MTTPFDPSADPSEREGEPGSPRSETKSQWYRQHPAACFFNITGAIRRMILPLIAGAVTIRGPILIFFLGVMLLIIFGSALLRYWRYRYRFTEHELVVEQGWLYRNVRHVAYARVQNINITRSLSHRIFRVSGMQLESASGSEPEAVMEALSQPAINEIHERVEEARLEKTKPPQEAREETPEEEEEEQKPLREPKRQILSIGVAELIRHGLISNRAMVLVAALLGFLYQGRLGEQIFPRILNWLEHLTDRSPTEIVEGLGPHGLFLFGVAGFILIIMALALLSVMYSVIRFYGFSLSVDSRSVRAEYGLFTRVAITIPKHRIQLIGFRANPFQRLCRRVAIKVETAGVSGGEENRASLRWLTPILPENEAARVLREVQPEVNWEAFEWRPLHPKTFSRLLRLRIIWLAIGTMALVLTTSVTGLLALLLIPIVLMYARGFFRYAGWAVTPTAIAHRSGWVVKQQSVVRYPKIQVVTLTRTPFDRRWGMATVHADTAGADPAGHGVRIRFLDSESASELKELLEQKTQVTKFVW